MSAPVRRIVTLDKCSACGEHEADVFLEGHDLCALCAHDVLRLCRRCGAEYQFCACEDAA